MNNKHDDITAFGALLYSECLHHREMHACKCVCVRILYVIIVSDGFNVQVKVKVIRLVVHRFETQASANESNSLCAWLLHLGHVDSNGAKDVMRSHSSARTADGSTSKETPHVSSCLRCDLEPNDICSASVRPLTP